MKAIKIHPNGKVEVKNYERLDKQTVRAEVGGLYAILHKLRIRQPYVLLVNEEYPLGEYPVNKVAGYLYMDEDWLYPLRGPVILCKEYGGTFEGLLPGEAKDLAWTLGKISEAVQRIESRQ